MDAQQHEQLSTSSIERLVCLICHYGPEAIHVFIVDLNRIGDCRSMSPALRIDSQLFDVYSVCVLKSTLYLFCPGFTATVDLTKHLSSKNVSLTESMVSKKKPSQSKTRYSTPTPDGNKILLFTDCIDTIDFELFDPDTNTWQPIARIALSYNVKIKGFAFLDDSTFFIETDTAGVFVLDICTFEWGAMSSFAASFCLNKGSLAFKGIELQDLNLYLGPYGAYDFHESELGLGLTQCCYFARDFVGGGEENAEYFYRSANGLPYREQNGEWKFFRVLTATNAVTMCPLMDLQICSFDFDFYKKMKQRAYDTFRRELQKHERMYKDAEKKLKDKYIKYRRSTTRTSPTYRDTLCQLKNSGGVFVIRKRYSAKLCLQLRNKKAIRVLYRKKLCNLRNIFTIRVRCLLGDAKRIQLKHRVQKSFQFRLCYQSFSSAFWTHQVFLLSG